MKLQRLLIALFTAGLTFNLALADETLLKQRVLDLEKRVTALEQRQEGGATIQRWKDPILWRRIKREMSTGDIQTLLGKPARIEQQIFATWYYHPTSKLHGFVWFDEDKVLGWKAPE